MATKIETPYPIFEDVDGQPLEDGYLYIGTAGLDPALNAITVYSDASLSTTVTQPVRTTAGFPVVSGSPIRLYTAATDFSLRVSNKNNTQISQDLNAGANAAVYSGITVAASGDISFSGDLDPSADNTHDLGNASFRWKDLFLSGNIVSADIRSQVDNGDDLGTASFRWKDLHTSGGIFFGAGGASKKLDDYEEGTFSPTFQNVGTGTYSVQEGRYTKIGNTVTLSIRIALATVGTASGSLRVTGLPFTSAATYYENTGAVYGDGWTTAKSDCSGYLPPSNTIVNLESGVPTTGAPTAPTHAELGTGNVLISFSYKV